MSSIIGSLVVDGLHRRASGGSHSVPQRNAGKRRILTLVTAGLVVLGLILPTMLRQAKGAIPLLLDGVLGIDLKEYFSLYSFTTGGSDYLLKATGTLFIVVGPLLRSALAVAWYPNVQSHYDIVMDGLGAFCAWEVLAVAILMALLLLPSTTNAFITSPLCSLVDTNGYCFQMALQVQWWHAGVAVTGGCLLVAVGSAPSRKGHAEEEGYELSQLKLQEELDDEDYEDDDIIKEEPAIV